MKVVVKIDPKVASKEAELQGSLDFRICIQLRLRKNKGHRVCPELLALSKMKILIGKILISLK